MSKYTAHAKAMAHALTPEQVVAQLNTLATQLETLKKSAPMYKAEGDEEMAPGFPPAEGEEPAPEGEPAPEMPPMEGAEPPMEGEPAPEMPPMEGGSDQAAEEVEQAVGDNDEAELREVFGDMESEEISQLVEFLVKLQEEKSAQVDKSSAGMDPLAMSQSFSEMKKSQNALQAQVVALTKSITTLTEQVKKPARPASRPALMNSESLTKSERVPEMLKKSEVVDFLATQIRRAGKPDADLLSIWQDASASSEDSTALRGLYNRAERIGVKIPHKG